MISSSNHALDGKSLCFSSLPRWICPTGSPRKRYECGPTEVSLGGTGVLQGFGDVAQCLEMLPRVWGRQGWVHWAWHGAGGAVSRKSCCSWGVHGARPCCCPHEVTALCPHSWPCSTRRFSTPSCTAWASLSSSTSGIPRSSTPTCRRCVPPPQTLSPGASILPAAGRGLLCPKLAQQVFKGVLIYPGGSQEITKFSGG